MEFLKVKWMIVLYRGRRELSAEIQRRSQDRHVLQDGWVAVTKTAVQEYINHYSWQNMQMIHSSVQTLMEKYHN